MTFNLKLQVLTQYNETLPKFALFSIKPKLSKDDL